jgi:hypothetical protein
VVVVTWTSDVRDTSASIRVCSVSEIDESRRSDM